VADIVKTKTKYKTLTCGGFNHRVRCPIKHPSVVVVELYVSLPSSLTLVGFSFSLTVDHALQAVKTILDRTRTPRLLSVQEPYVYNVSSTSR
jgi:hypothetical protein